MRSGQGTSRHDFDVTYYLCLCTYGGTWHPLAIQLDNDVVGFLMWAVDDDHSRWIGELVIDAAHQRHGVGRAAVVEAIRLLIAQPDCPGIALSYHPANHAARSLYAALGFTDTARPPKMASSSAGSDWTTRRDWPAAKGRTSRDRQAAA